MSRVSRASLFSERPSSARVTRVTVLSGLRKLLRVAPGEIESAERSTCSAIIAGSRKKAAGSLAGSEEILLRSAIDLIEGSGEGDAVENATRLGTAQARLQWRYLR